MILLPHLARYVAKNYLEIPKPFKRYQLGSVWRNENQDQEDLENFYNLMLIMLGQKIYKLMQNFVY